MIIKYFIFFYFFLFYINNSNSYSDEETTCYKNLLDKLGVSYQTNSSGYIDFCNSTTFNLPNRINCKSANANIFEFSLEQVSNNIIDYTDITCISEIYMAHLMSWHLSDTFFNFNKSITVFNIDNCFNIKLNYQIQSEQLSFFLNEAIKEPINLSKIITSYLTISSYGSSLNYSNDVYINNDYNGQIKNIGGGYSILTRNIPSMKNITSGASINYVLSSNFDYNSYYNISTHSEIVQVILDGSLDVYHPMIPFSVFTDMSDALSSSPFSILQINYPLLKPINYLDYSVGRVLFKYLYLNNVGSEFNINGNLPFLSFPKNIIEFGYNDGKILMPNFDIFKNTTILNILLRNNSISGNLPKWDNSSSILNIDFRNNSISGSIDSSYCDVVINVANNNLTGQLPDCYTCWMFDPIFRLNFEGNSITNGSTSICEIIPNLKFKYTEFEYAGVIYSTKLLYFFGKNLGYDSNINQYSSNVEFNPEINMWSNVMQNSIYATTQYFYSRTIHKLTYKYTNQVFYVTPDPYPPQLYNITVLDHLLTINGQYFSYNVSIIAITIGDKECSIQNATFFQIVCSLPVYPNPSKNVSSLLRVDELETSFRIDLDDNTGTEQFNNYTSCPGYCENITNSQCNYNTGKCECIPLWTGLDLIGNCTIPYHYMSSVIPSDENGGQVLMNGVFGDYHFGIKVYIGDSECTINKITSSSIDCNITAGRGTYNITIIQNDIYWVGLKSYTYQSTKQNCLNNCTSLNNGICNVETGICKCNSKYSGLDCSSPIENNNNGNNGNSNSTVNEDGSTTVTNQYASYSIFITKLLEYDINGNTVNSFNLQNQWKINTNETTTIDSNNITFIQILNNSNCQISLTIQQINNDMDLSFAGIDLHLQKGSIKVTVSILNYDYSSPLNTLQLQMISNVSSSLSSTDSAYCNIQSSQSTISIQDNQLLNYITISKDNKILYGRFINRAISDNHPTLISTSLISNQNNNSITIGINLPHGKNIIIDPDFSVLVSPSFKSKCGDIDSNKSYIIPIAIVIPLVAIVIIVSICYFIYKKRADKKFKKRIVNLTQ